MADLNALIAQGYQFQPLPDPFAQYGKMQQLQNAGIQNQLTQQQLAAAQRAEAQTNTLNQAYSSAVNPATGEIDYAKLRSTVASGGAGSQIPSIEKSRLEGENAKLEYQTKNTALLKNKIDMLPEAYARADTPAAYIRLHETIHADPILGRWLDSIGSTKEQGRAKIDEAIQNGTFDQLRAGSMQSVADIKEQMGNAAYAKDALAPAGVAPAVVQQGEGAGPIRESAPSNPLVTFQATNALAPPAPAINALAAGAVTAESVAKQIRQGNIKYGNASNWVKDREILMKQYEALLNPRQRTFAAIDASKYTPESIRAFNVSGDQSDLVAVKPKDNIYAAIDPSKYTPASLKLFKISGDQSDLVAIAPKDNIYAAIDPSKYTPASLAAFEASGKRSDLIAIAPKDNIFAAINPSDYTPASVAAFEASGKRSDLIVRDKPFAPPAPERVFAAINPSEYTQASLKAFSVSGDRSDLIAREKPVAAERLFAPINPSDYTPASVAAFEASGNRADLVAIPKTTKTESTMGKVDIDKFTPASLAKYAKSGDYLDLVALPPKPTAAATPAAPVAVVGTDGKIKFVSREEAIAKGMTPASAQEGLAPKEIQSREAKYPAATSAIKTFEAKTDSLAADLEKLAKHPGLSGISGIIYGRTPAVTQEARAAQALYDSIVARGGFAELQNMRAASPTGGALGNVSNQEGQYLRDAFAPISRTQDTRDLSTALTNAANATRASKQRVREAYDMTYDYKTANTPAVGGEWKVVK